MLYSPLGSFVAGCKYWARRMDVGLRSRVARPDSRFGLRSASDGGAYPELALQAALDGRVFSVFRRHPDYTPILEHLHPSVGDEYLSIILKRYGLSPARVLEIVEPLRVLGAPRLYSLSRLSAPVSLTALRYLKVALDLVELHGAELGHVVEIGCGFGGQAVILDRVASLQSYTFVDIWQVGCLIRRFVEAAGVSMPYCITTLGERGWARETWDLLLSNYAFSELPRSLQLRYFDLLLASSRYGYMTMNSGSEGRFGSILNLSRPELLSMLSSAEWVPEVPLTMPDNYILTWRDS